MSQATERPREDGPRDLLSLAMARMPDLLAALEAEARDEPVDPAERRGRTPSRALQIGHLIVAEAVRLIRVGTRQELAAAAVGTTRLVARSREGLADRHREAYRLLSGASIVLAAANSPASSAGELTVLRSWNGKAREAVALVSRAPDYELSRIRLRELLAIDESHMSHMLADLEAAGLVVRRRYGREVTVYLGPTGHTDRVQEQLRETLVPDPDEGGGLVPDEQALDIWNDLAASGRTAETDDQVRLSNLPADLVFMPMLERQWRQGEADNTDQDVFPEAGSLERGESLLDSDVQSDEALIAQPLVKGLHKRPASRRLAGVD